MMMLMMMMMMMMTKDSSEIVEELSRKFDQSPTNCLRVSHWHHSVSWWLRVFIWIVEVDLNDACGWPTDTTLYLYPADDHEEICPSKFFPPPLICNKFHSLFARSIIICSAKGCLCAPKLMFFFWKRGGIHFRSKKFHCRFVVFKTVYFSHVFWGKCLKRGERERIISNTKHRKNCECCPFHS